MIENDHRLKDLVTEQVKAEGFVQTSKKVYWSFTWAENDFFLKEPSTLTLHSRDVQHERL